MDERFRAIQADGKELVLPSVPDVVEAFSKGFLTADSMLFDEQTRKWVRLGDHDIFTTFIASSRASKPDLSEPLEGTGAHEPFASGHTEKSVVESADAQDLTGPLPGGGQTSRGGMRWIIAIVIAFPLILVYSSSNSSIGLQSVAYIAGYCMGQTLLAFLMFWAIFLRKKTPAVAKIICLFAIYAAFGAGAMVSNVRARRDARNLLNVAESELSRIKSGDTGSLAQQGRGISRVTGSGGELGEMERYIKEIADLTLTERNNYEQELDAIGWTRILEPSRVAGDKTFAESRAILASAADIVKKYRSKSDALLKQCRSMIDELKISDAMKKDMTKGFDESMPESSSSISRQWDLEEETVAEFGRMIDLLAAGRNHWTVQGSQFLFSRDSDLQRFNASLDMIKSYGDQEKALEQQRADGVDRNLSKIRDSLK